MFHAMTALHLIAAIFIVGPLVHAATTAGRALRTKDSAAATSAARMVTIYGYASTAVVIFGFGLMSAASPYRDGPVAKFAETWIWLSVILWVLTVALAMFVTAPALKKAAARLADGAQVGSLKAQYAMSGGIIAILYLVIVVLMVYKP